MKRTGNWEKEVSRRKSGDQYGVTPEILVCKGSDLIQYSTVIILS